MAMRLISRVRDAFGINVPLRLLFETPTVADMAAALASHVKGKRCDTIALSGGCFQNRWLTEEVVRRLQSKGFRVLMHSKVPANDGGLALGQAVTAAGRLLRT